MTIYKMKKHQGKRWLRIGEAEVRRQLAGKETDQRAILEMMNLGLPVKTKLGTIKRST